MGKENNLNGLTKIIASSALSVASMFSSPGCSSINPKIDMSKPTVGKIALTPITLVRDVIDIPLSSMTTFWRGVAESGKRTTGRTQSGIGINSRGGVGVGLSVDVSYPVGMILTGAFGAVDYTLCRSIYPCFPEGVSPIKRYSEYWFSEFFFPNTRTLWEGKHPRER